MDKYAKDIEAAFCVLHSSVKRLDSVKTHDFLAIEKLEIVLSIQGAIKVLEKAMKVGKLKPKEPTDEQFSAYTETQGHIDWVEENRGGMDQVEFEEMNHDAICESCCDWLDEMASE